MSAVVRDALVGKSFLNLFNASIFFTGSLIREASWSAFASGAVSRPVVCAAVAGVAGVAWSAGGAALSGSVVWALAAEMASERRMVEKTVLSFILQDLQIRFPKTGTVPNYPFTKAALAPVSWFSTLAERRPAKRANTGSALSQRDC